MPCVLGGGRVTEIATMHLDYATLGGGVGGGVDSGLGGGVVGGVGSGLDASVGDCGGGCILRANHL